MTVKHLSELNGFKAVSLPEPELTVNGVYIGDLLSWVMGKAKPNNAWVTIMSNINVLAVASLTESSCVILAEGVTAEPEFLKLAVEKSVNVIESGCNSFEIAKILLANGLV